jgi:integrase
LQIQANEVGKQKALTQTSNQEWREMDLVFPSRVGTPMPEKRLREEFVLLCKAANVPVIQVHRTRATYNSVLSLDLRAPPKLVADRMGHSDEETQVKFYQSVSDEQRRTLALSAKELYGVKSEVQPEEILSKVWRDKNGLN